MSLMEESSFKDRIIFVLYISIIMSYKSTSFRLVLNMPVRDVRKHRDLHLERKHVYNVYDQIAPKFSEISQKAWPNVRRFLKDLPPGSIVADIGSWIQKLQKQQVIRIYFALENKTDAGFNEIIRILLISMSYIWQWFHYFFSLIWA